MSLGQKAYIYVGKIKDAFKVTINGEDIVTNQVSGIAEISEFLAEGKNEIKINVATSMLNAVIYENRDILNEDGRVLDDRHNSSYGLSEDVIISAKEK